MKRRDQFALALAPVFAATFFRSGDSWDNYEDLAESVFNMVDALERRARETERKPRRRAHNKAGEP